MHPLPILTAQPRPRLLDLLGPRVSSLSAAITFGALGSLLFGCTLLFSRPSLVLCVARLLTLPLCSFLLLCRSLTLRIALVLTLLLLCGAFALPVALVLTLLCSTLPLRDTVVAMLRLRFSSPLMLGRRRPFGTRPASLRRAPRRSTLRHVSFASPWRYTRPWAVSGSRPWSLMSAWRPARMWPTTFMSLTYCYSP
jgi:hypothetical protein